MAIQRILIADDDPDILDVLEITLSGDNYEIVKANDGEEALNIIRSRPLDLVLLDYKMPKKDGRQVCLEVKKDLLLRQLPIIMVTGKGEVSDKVGGIDAGADDYIVKPFNPEELLARVRMILRRTASALEANPLTRLPGNISIMDEINKRLEQNKIFAFSYLDLDKFKAYNDTYGFERGDEVIKETARILLRAIKEKGSANDFIGHIGGDDFVIVAEVGEIDAVCRYIIEEFEKVVPQFYNEQDRVRGYIIAHDRKGIEQQVPLVSISIGVVTNETRKFTHAAQVAEIAAELKQRAKKLERSNFIKDQRQDNPK
ncbi:MAG: response regulator [Candidatus Omnitrophica bacterium]|nr:response regulator [Candidatus Omnitrophota bacterium]MDD5610729.1 response regulator [Candidatus Omnitrophota bacterium]